MSLAAGTRLGPYEVLSLIGAGGMGEVYEARDTRLDRSVALKIISTAETPPDARQRFAREVGRAVDYLQSRPDVDGEQRGYYGLSWGAVIAPVPLALDSRFKVATLVSGGLFWAPLRPDADPANFLPHVRVPVLMVNGQYDWFFAPQSRRTFFELLGSPARRYLEIPGVGHAGPRNAMVAETLAWLDRYLAPVRTRESLIPDR